MMSSSIWPSVSSLRPTLSCSITALRESTTFDRGSLSVRLLEIVPGFHAHGVGARQHREAFVGVHRLDQQFDFVARLHGHYTVLGKLSRIDDALRLVAKVD